MFQIFLDLRTAPGSRSRHPVSCVKGDQQERRQVDRDGLLDCLKRCCRGRAGGLKERDGISVTRRLVAAVWVTRRVRVVSLSFLSILTAANEDGAHGLRLRQTTRHHDLRTDDPHVRDRSRSSERQDQASTHPRIPLNHPPLSITVLVVSHLTIVSYSYY